MSSKSIDVEKIRADFPIFSHIQKSGQQFIYFDSAASAQKPKVVIDAITNFYATQYAPVHRSFYDLGEQATEQYEQARATVARFINVQHTEEVIFTKGTTEGINFVAQTWALENLKAGDEILTTHAEHHANLIPWQQVAQKTGAKLTFVPMDKETSQLVFTEDLITEKTKLVAVTHASNVVGEVWDGQLENVIKQAHSVGAKVLIDSAQSAMHKKIDVQTLAPDFLVLSGHKILGPTGIGVLYIKKDLHDSISPYHYGGAMVNFVALDHATWADAPQKFEAGTPNTGGAIGLAAAIDYINATIDFDVLKNHETVLCTKLLDGLKTIDGIEIAGNLDIIQKHGYLVSFSIDGLHAHDLATTLGASNIAVRAGNHCARPIVELLGFDALLRVSFGIYNSERDVEIFLQELGRAIHFFKKLTKGRTYCRSNGQSNARN